MQLLSAGRRFFLASASVPIKHTIKYNYKYIHIGRVWRGTPPTCKISIVQHPNHPLRPYNKKEYGGKSTDNTYEEQRLAILEYYVGGRVYNPQHDRPIIDQLRNQGYLKCGVTPDIKETFKTTRYGTWYLDILGVHNPAHKRQEDD